MGKIPRYRPTPILRSFTSWPGAKKLELPFKKAVEQFLLKRYGKRIRKGKITKEFIKVDDPALYIALNHYQQRFGANPLGIKTKYDRARENFELAKKVGFENLPEPARRSARGQQRKLQRSRLTR